jgi:xanthine dehydrogenase accessory factor
VQRELVDALREVLDADGTAALATVVRTGGSTPQGAGARMLLFPDGRSVGTVGGGAIEAAVRTELEACLADGRARLVTRELGHDLGMCCGGRMEVFVERVEGEPRLVLCGAGHIAHALAPLLPPLGFRVTVVDERDEHNTEARFPGAARELQCPRTFLRKQPLSAADYVLVTTHDHQLDEHVLELALRQPPRYVGLVGSRRKVFRLLERIRVRAGELDLARLYAPVGLALGGRSPAEIALSIAAELVAVRRGAAGAGHMRMVERGREAP